MPDAYQYPNGTLQNKLHETDAGKLAESEFQYVSGRALELRAMGLPRPYDMAKLQAVHAYLFQDVYKWAGELRTINITKAEFETSADVTRFAPANLLVPTMARFDRKLREADYLRGLDKDAFVTQAANLLVGINNLHPFREGNGRAQRFFMRSLAQDAGYDFDFDVVTKDRMIATSIAGARGDNAPMRRLLEEISDPERVAALRKAYSFLVTLGGKFADVYLATTVAGQTYDATLVQRAFPDFMVRIDKPEPRIIIGHADDLDEAVENSQAFTFTPRRF